MTPNVTFPPHAVKKLRMRAYLGKFTREARGGQEEYWQEKLQDFDPELSLRWSWLNKRWLIVYDHHGQIEVIRSFERGQPFGEVLQYVKFNSTLTSRKLQQFKREQDEAVEKEQDERIGEAGEEFGTELHHATRRRLISDGMTKLGGR